MTDPLSPSPAPARAGEAPRRPLTVYRVNECEWYVAPTLYDAVCAAMKDCGLPFEEACDDELGEVPPEKMQRLVFVDDDETRRSFSEQLECEIARDPKTARSFASTEF